jgi:hypothetical protein
MNSRVKSVASDAIHKAGFMVEAEVKASIAGQRDELRSVDTGRFLSSVNTDNSVKLQSTVKSDVEYAPHLEYGTSRITARKHFRNSARRKESQVRSFVISKLRPIV